MEFPDLEDQIVLSVPITPIDRFGNTGITSLSLMTKKSIALLRPYLAHSSARLRRAAFIGLAMLDDRASLPLFMDALKDPNQTVRDSAVLALGILRDGEAKHTLLHLARGTPIACRAIDQSQVPDYFRGFAQVSLALEEVAGTEKHLCGIVDDPKTEPQVKAMALEGIGLVGGEESVKYLIDYVEGSRQVPELMSIAVTALAKTREAVSVPFLRRCLNSKHLEVRQSAALGLGEIANRGDAAVVKDLYRVFKQTNDQALRGFSLVSMGRIGGEVAMAYLNRELVKGRNADKPWICLGLGFALKGAPDREASKRLVHLASHASSRSTRGAAAIGLGLAKDRESIATLSRILETGDDPWYRGYSAMALGLIGDPSSAQALEGALRNDSLPQVRTQAAMALALIKNTRSSQELIDLLMESSNDSTKAFVTLSLSFMADLETIEKIHEVMRENDDLDDLTLSHLVHLTAKVLSGRAVPYLDRVAAGSNFACEYPLVKYLLDFGI
jgi:HEAT repeat protein